MEVLAVPGYSLEDKLPIASLHLLPRQRREHGLADTDLQIPELVLQGLVQGYTQEAGVRTLERRLGALCRAVAVTLAEEGSEARPQVVDAEWVEGVLGPPSHTSGLEGRLEVPGVCLGLAWTPVGGKVRRRS